MALDALLGAMANAGTQPPGVVLGAVLRAAGPRPVAVWARSPDGWLRRVAATPGWPAGPDRVRGTEALRGSPDVAWLTSVVDGEVDRGVLTWGHRPDRAPASTQEQADARDVAAFVALLLRRPQLRAELYGRLAEASRLSKDLAASRERLSRAADLESRRMVTDIMAFGGEELARLRAQAHRLRGREGAAHTATPAAVLELRQTLDDLIARLRTMARGVYPHVLSDSGIRAAVQELVTTFPRAVRLRGHLADVPKEVESGLYWAAAAVLQALMSRDGPAPPVQVTLRVDNQHAEVRVVDPRPSGAAQLEDVLPAARDRIAAVGGWLVHDADANGVVVRLRSPVNLAPAVPAMDAMGGRPAAPEPADAGAELRDQVWGLVMAAVDMAEATDQRALRRVLTRLDQPPAPGRATPLAATMEALAALDAVTRREPGGWLRYEYERLRATTHVLDEEELVATIRSGALALPEPDIALRLLGADGFSALTRLGLADTADRPAQRAAAADQVTRWRARAESGAEGVRERAAYRLLARSAESLLMRLAGEDAG